MQKRGSLTQSALGEILIVIHFISWQAAQKQGIGAWWLLIHPCLGKKAVLSLGSRRIQMIHVIFGKGHVAVEWTWAWWRAWRWKNCTWKPTFICKRLQNCIFGGSLETYFGGKHSGEYWTIYEWFDIRLGDLHRQRSNFRRESGAVKW